MAFNGAGVFVRIYNWTNDANASININSGRMDTEDTGFAFGLSNCICKDGQTTITANLPMATFRHTGVGNGVNRTDYAAVGQQQDGKFVYLGTTGGAADVQTAAGTPTLTAYAAGQVFRFIAGFTNATTTPTLNIDALGAKTIQKLGAVLAASDITTGNSYEVMYDGTYFQMLSILPAGASEIVLLGTATASTSATLDFTSLMTSGYSSYIVIIASLLTSTTSSIGIYGSSNNGSTWVVKFNYQNQVLTYDTSAPTYSGSTNASPAPITSSFASFTYSGKIEIVNPNSSTGDASMQAFTSNNDHDRMRSDIIMNSASGFNAIRLAPSAGTFTSGKVYLYGVKNT
jgi:hypothetical protein